MENANKYCKINKMDAVEKFCRHLRDGFSKECFIDFDYSEVHRMADEIDKENNNNECSDLIERAYREYKYYWEKAGIDNIYTEFEENKIKVKKFNRGIWMFMYKLKREINSGQTEIPFEGLNVIRLKSNS
jgi:hypothetical protein